MSMKPVLAIAQQTIRQSIRSRLAVSFLSLAVVLVLGMPLVLRGDGTLEGQYRILLVYTLNGSFVLLVLAALWSACAAAATDIASRRLHLVIVKPVAATTLWFGQWLGLTALHGLLLLFVWAVTLAQLHWRTPAAATAAAGTSDPRVTARVIVPNSIPAADSTGTAGTEVYFRIPPGHRQTVGFQLPRSTSPDRRAYLDLYFAASHTHTTGDAMEIPLFLDIGGQSRESHARISGRFRAGTHYRIDDIPLAEAVDGRLYVTLHNPLVDPPITVVINKQDGLRLRVPAGGPLRNHLRAALILLSRIGFFIAVGLTAGIMFSFPVAAFIGAFWLLFASLAGYIQSVLSLGVLVVPHEGLAPDPSLMDKVIMTVFRFFDIVLQPLRTPRVIPMLGSGELIPGGDVGASFAVLWAGYAGLLAIAGILALRRRELAR